MKKKKDVPLPEFKMPDAGELPEGWNSTILSEIGKWRTGGTPSRKISSYFNGDVAWVKSGDLKDGIVSVTDEKISESGLENCAAKLLPVGTVSVALYGATIGKVGILGIEAATNQACANCIVDHNKISKEFLFYYILSQRQNLIDAGQGGAQPNLTNQIIHDWPISLPPLAEQQRIVARVEALLEPVNAARDRLNRVPLIMKRFRQAVLAAACSGRLTEGWRVENLEAEPASELLQKIKPEVRGKKVNAKQATNDFFEFDQFELPDSWIWTTTSDICTEISDGDHYPPPKIPSGVPFIVISNISSGSIDFTRTMFASQKYYDDLANNRKPQFRDILYTVTGSYGIPVLVDTHREFCFQRHIALLRPHPIIPSEFLWILMKSDLVYKQSTSIATGIAQLTVPLSGLRVLKIPLPPLAEQHEIVRRVGMLFERADAIDREVEVAGRRCERLTQAVLGKAFAGKL